MVKLSVIVQDVYVLCRLCGYVFRSVAVAIAVCGGITYVAITVSYSICMYTCTYLD